MRMILELLNIDEMRGVSKTIDIAKGKNKIPESWNEGYDQIKRKKAWLKKH